MPCAASPPSTFCHDHVTTSSLSHGSGMANTAEVASQITSPARSAAIQSPCGHPHAGGGAVPGQHDIMRGIDRGEIGQAPVRRGEHARVGHAQLLRDVRGPGLGETLEGQHIDRPRAEQRPQREFHGTGVGGRHDGQPPVVRNAEAGVRAARNHLDQPCLGARAPGGCARAARRRARRATSRVAWRRGRMRNWGSPDAGPAAGHRMPS